MERGAGAAVPGHPAAGGIGYADEQLWDRDKRGVLWMRVPWRPGTGRPEFGKVHAGRQRRAMTRLLCQVCGGPADRNGDGLLWIAGEDPGDPGSWPRPFTTLHPPVCAPCARRSALACPHLRREHALLRVHAWELAGVRGVLYHPKFRGLATFGPAGVGFGDPRIAWTRASQLIMRLKRFTVTELP